MKCPLCGDDFEHIENQILLMAYGEPNLNGEPEYVCRSCYFIHGDNPQLDGIENKETRGSESQLMYVYTLSEHNPEGNLYTVGFYDPQGKWHPESDWDDKEKAAERVHYLNGSK